VRSRAEYRGVMDNKLPLKDADRIWSW